MKAVAAGFLDGRFDVSGTSSKKPLGAPEMRKVILSFDMKRQHSNLTKRGDIDTSAMCYGRMLVILLLVLPNRHQWQLAAILRSGYV